MRYPDALVTCTKNRGDARLIEGVVVVFEVVSASSDRTDRIGKLRGYRALPSIRRYVLLQECNAGPTVLEREAGVVDWKAGTLVAEETLNMPEIGIEIPVAEFYDFPKDGRWPPDDAP